MEEYVRVFVSEFTEKKFWLIDFFDENNIFYKISFEGNRWEGSLKSPVYVDLQYYWVEKKYEEKVLNFIENYLAEVEEIDENMFAEGFFESADDVEDVSFKGEFNTLAEINIENLIENSEMPFVFKTDNGVIKELKKIFKSIESDLDYFISYEGGKFTCGRGNVNVNDVDFDVEMKIEKSGDNKPFEIICRFTQKI